MDELDVRQKIRNDRIQQDYCIVLSRRWICCLAKLCALSWQRLDGVRGWECVILHSCLLPSGASQGYFSKPTIRSGVGRTFCMARSKHFIEQFVDGPNNDQEPNIAFSSGCGATYNFWSGFLLAVSIPNSRVPS